MTGEKQNKVGRFAPTPSGRMHLGNVMTAILAYLSAKSDGGRCLLRIEDLDKARCKQSDIDFLLADLAWLGFTFDGGYGAEEYQSRRSGIYGEYFARLKKAGLVYDCYCTRGELAASAPHASDGQAVYNGKCRNAAAPPGGRGGRASSRLAVPDETVSFTDGLQGYYAENLANDCGDFIIRRSDGVFAYQLAVVIDDALSGMTEVVRGLDLISSTPRQIYLYRLLGFTPPAFYHTPLILDTSGVRLAKRDRATGMEEIRNKYSSPEPILGMLAYNIGLLERYKEIGLTELIGLFSWEKIKRSNIILDGCGVL